MITPHPCHGKLFRTSIFREERERFVKLFSQTRYSIHLYRYIYVHMNMYVFFALYFVEPSFFKPTLRRAGPGRAGPGRRRSPIKSFPRYGQYDTGIINVLSEEKLKMDWLSASQQQSYRERRPRADLLMAYLAPRRKGNHLHLKYCRQYLLAAEQQKRVQSPA